MNCEKLLKPPGDASPLLVYYYNIIFFLKPPKKNAKKFGGLGKFFIL
jgi:hypothetical protein